MVKSIFIQKYVVLLTMALLCVSYLGVNLLNFDAYIIFAIRAFAVLILIYPILFYGRINLRFSAVDLFLISVIIFGALTSFVSINLLFIVLFVYGARDLSEDFLVSTAVFLLGCSIFFSLLYADLNELGGVVDATEASYGEELIRERITFGFKNVNAFAGLILTFCLLLVAHGQKLALRCIVSVLIAYIFYIYTDSRTLLIGVFLFLIFWLTFFIFRNYRNFLRYVAFVTIFTPVGITLFSVFIVEWYGDLDLLLSNRLSHVAVYFNELPSYRFVIGGGEPSRVVTLDNAFALLLGSIGFPVFVILLWRFIRVLTNCIDFQNGQKFSFFLSFWIISFSESGIVRPDTVLPLIFWHSFLLRSK